MDKLKLIAQANLNESAGKFNIGDTVRVDVRIKEAARDKSKDKKRDKGNDEERERIQAFEGTVIAKKNGGISETFIVRRISYGVGVERIFPMHSPNIANVEVIRRGKVRRAKLYYLRDRVGKSAKIKEHLR